MDNTGDGDGGSGDDSTVAVPLVDLEPTVAVTVYEPVALSPSVTEVDALPLLPVVALVGFSDALPSPDVILNVTVLPEAALPSSWTSTVNVNASPGSPDPGPLITLMDNTVGGGVLTVAVPLVDLEPTVAVTVYEPVALSPSVTEVDALPLLPVVALVGFSDALPSPDVILNVTVLPEAALPSSWTSTVNVNASPGSPDPGPTYHTYG